jgi:hypothetical protein
MEQMSEVKKEQLSFSMEAMDLLLPLMRGKTYIFIRAVLM